MWSKPQAAARRVFWTGTHIVAPDDTRPVEAVPWRQIQAAGHLAGAAAGQGPATTPDADADFRKRLADLERQWQEKVRQARAAGAAEGETAGKNRAATELQPVLERLSATIVEIAGLR